MTSQRRLPAHSEEGLLNNVDRSGLHVSLFVRQESFHATGFQLRVEHTTQKNSGWSSSGWNRRLRRTPGGRPPGGTHDSEEFDSEELRVEHTTQKNSGWSSSLSVLNTLSRVLFIVPVFTVSPPPTPNVTVLV
jgi:hypothetical protein